MFDEKIKKIRQGLIKEKLDAVLISSVSNISYLTDYANFSKDEREAYLVITKNDQFIITDGRYKEAVLKEVPHFKLLELSSNNSLKNIFGKFGQKMKILGIEENNLTISEHKFFKKHFKKIKHLSINTHRTIKSEEEINKIQKACQLGDKTLEYVLKRIKLGITEKELAFELEFSVRKNGAEISFPSIVAFGKNSSIPHHHTGETKLNTGEFVLMDFGVKFENYCSDMTRTIFFGKPINKQRDMYTSVLEAQKKAVEFINLKINHKKKVTASEVDKVARQYIISRGYPTIPHSLGHGIGLEVHEHPHISPKSKEELKPGMVFSIEPGIYIPGFGGVRIEDLFVCEKQGLRQITTSPRNIIEV